MAATAGQHGAGALRAVALYQARIDPPAHECASHRAVAEGLADLMGLPFVGEYAAGMACAGLYFVPTDTLDPARARELGIDGEHRLFGGVVPWAYVGGKGITHPLAAPGATAPAGWSTRFAQGVTGAVLPGFTAFTKADAQRAGERLLAGGAVRVKRVRATAGRGQRLVRDVPALAAALAELDADEVAACGVVLERHLEEVVTHSVGQVRVAGMVASYYGLQCLTEDNRGATVYGGSELFVARGGFDALLARRLAPEVRLAIEQARRYDASACAAFEGFFASRRNYDVAQGRDPEGRRVSGVLEQSWRVGGASPAEIAALRLFAAEPGLGMARAVALERYGDVEPPPGAHTIFRGDDLEVGPITKSVMVEPYDDAQ